MDSPLSFSKTGSGRQVFFKELKAGAKILYFRKKIETKYRKAESLSVNTY